MFVSAKTYFKNGMPHNIRLLIRANTQLPEEFIKRYKKNVSKITPKKSGWLRRSIITQVEPGRGEITWRAVYAAAQNQGWHTTKSGKRAIYKRYTTGGTGAKFATEAFKKTKAEMPAVYRELGLTK